jgi:hypothetical protein
VDHNPRAAAGTFETKDGDHSGGDAAYHFDPLLFEASGRGQGVV